jgi:hypothetical protein
MSSKKTNGKRADQTVPVSSAPYPVRTGGDFHRGVTLIQRVAENFSKVEKRRENDGMSCK